MPSAVACRGGGGRVGWGVFDRASVGQAARAPRAGYCSNAPLPSRSRCRRATPATGRDPIADMANLARTTDARTRLHVRKLATYVAPKRKAVASQDQMVVRQRAQSAMDCSVPSAAELQTMAVSQRRQWAEGLSDRGISAKAKHRAGQALRTDD